MGLNSGKAPRPDELPKLILQNAANEISLYDRIIFKQSLQTGKLPDDWVEIDQAKTRSILYVYLNAFRIAAPPGYSD